MHLMIAIFGVIVFGTLCLLFTMIWWLQTRPERRELRRVYKANGLPGWSMW